MTRSLLVARPCGIRPRGAAMRTAAVLALAALAAPVSPARAGGPPLQFTMARPDLPVLAPSGSGVAQLPDGTPLYERAPVPNEGTLEPQYDPGGSSDPVQPSVISRGSKSTEAGGYSRNSSANAAQESRMKPGLGFALHVPTE